MILLLRQMKSVTDQARLDGQTSLLTEDVRVLHTQFLSLLTQADQVHPRAPTVPGQRGKAKQHPARNLLDRLPYHHSEGRNV